MKDGGKLVEANFFSRSTLKVAEDLVGKYLFSKKGGRVCGGKIVETEAYLGKNDRASHAARKKTARNAVMFGPPGTIYVYLIYGIHYCFNLVCESEGEGAAVLIRALKPSRGLKLMKKRRKTGEVKEIASGPAKLTQALSIDTDDNGKELSSNGIYVVDRGETVDSIACGPRIGITKSKDLDYRFFIEDNCYVS
ncbi:MAG: DNA-3-methyladenine glycosylase [Elusimicrobiota bacterium]